MAAALNTPSPTRRGLLSAGVALAALPAAAGGVAAPAAALAALPAGDAALVALHGQVHRAWQDEREAMEAGWAAAEGKGGDVAASADAVDAAFDRYAEAIEQMAAIGAAGPAGLAAKAAAVSLFVEHSTSGLNDGEAELLASMAEDGARLLGSRAEGEALEALRRTDAALIDACDAWLEAGDQLQAASDDPVAGLDLVARRCTALATITATRAFTRSGRAAKAMVLLKLTWGRGAAEARLAASLASDLVPGQ